ncbi:MAG TPA: ThiF family adenylyltransferase [Chloroflexota bacterium]|nr:ThiF family adenylyltransferase [Chloroflexota bacterium]
MDRYSRQILFPGIGEDGQRRLLASRTTLVGCGALGTVLANALVRAGVGYLRIVDRDYVELSNLQRQILFDEDDAREGAPKAVAAAAKLARINSEVHVEAVIEDFGPDNAERLVRDSDLVLDGTDNFETRYVLNDACVKLGRPWVYAAAIASYGVVMPIVPGETSCLRCVFVQPPPTGSVDTCDTAGVLGPLPGVIANLAATEAIKLLVGAREQLSQGLLWVDVWHNSVQRTPLAGPASDCPTCQARRFEFLEDASRTRATTLCGRDAVQVRPTIGSPLDLHQLASRLAPIGRVQHNPHLLRLTVGGYQLTVFADGRTIVKGTSDPAIARSLYARYVGT